MIAIVVRTDLAASRNLPHYVFPAPRSQGRECKKTLVNLAAIYIVKGEIARAEEHPRKAAELNPWLPDIHYNKAQVAEKQGRSKEAEAEYLKELAISPKHFMSMYNLSLIYRMTGNTGREYEFLQLCLAADPSFPLTYFYLARICMNRGERYREAIDFVKKGIELTPERSELPLGFFLLADLYNRIGGHARSPAYAQKGQALAASLDKIK